jgi:hypothetical protein
VINWITQIVVQLVQLGADTRRYLVDDVAQKPARLCLGRGKSGRYECGGYECAVLSHLPFPLQIASQKLATTICASCDRYRPDARRSGGTSKAL